MRMSMSTTRGLSRRAAVDGGDAVLDLADDLQLGVGLEDAPQAGAHDGLVVGDEHRDAHGGPASSGSRARTANPPPSGRSPASSSPP